MKYTLLSLTMIGAMLGVTAHAAENGDSERGHRGDKMFERVDTNKDGAISREESQAFHNARFSEMDSNSDGKVSKEEANAYHKSKWAEHKARTPNAQ